MNIKKFSITVLSVLIMALTSCSEDSIPSISISLSSQNQSSSSLPSGPNVTSDSHSHTFSDEWDYDEQYHWKNPTCEHDVYDQKEYHDFEDKIVDATFDENGYTLHTCKVCGYSYKDNITSMKQHTYSDEWSHDEKNHWHACTDKGCEDEKKDVSEHSFRKEKTKPTYDKGGYTTYTCRTCGYSYVGDETNPKEHKYSSSWEYDENKHWRECTDSGFTDLKIDEVEHDYETVYTEPTYDEKGYYTHTCKVCNYSYTEEYGDKLEHTYSEEWEYNDTEHWHECLDSMYWYLKGSEGEHDYKEEVIEPTSTEEGYTVHTCKVCGYSYNDDYTDPVPYTLKWFNYDGTLLYEEKDHVDGDLPRYKGETPKKPHDEEYEYEFTGWDPEPIRLTKDAPKEFTAQFKEKDREGYYVTFYDDTNNKNQLKVDYSLIASNYSISYSLENTEDKVFMGWEMLNDDKIYQKDSSLGELDHDVDFYAVWTHKCEECAGSGEIDTRWSCGTCGGKGSVTTFTQCSKCRGIGTESTIQCRKCGYQKILYGVSGGGLSCPKCGGGNWNVLSTRLCTACNGTRGTSSTKKCSSCNGVGHGGSIDPCGHCHGEGIDRIAAPTIDTLEFNKVVLKPIEGYEYSQGGEVYQDSNVFEGLISNTDYCFYQRAKGDASTLVGLPSYSLCTHTPDAPIYNISYNLNGGTNNASNLTQYTEETDDFTIMEPTKGGYTFLGWTGSNGEEYEKEITIPKGSSGDLTYKANWEINHYSIEYVLDGGTNQAKNPSTYTVLDDVELKNASKDYYDFEGWYLDACFKNNITNINGYHEDLTLYAHFIPYTFNATFNAGVGKFNYNVTVVWDKKMANSVYVANSDAAFYPYETIEIPTRSGYNFGGFFFDKDFKKPITESFTVTEDVTLYAYWPAHDADSIELTSAQTFSDYGNSEYSSYVYFYVSPEHSGTATLSYYLKDYRNASNRITASQFELSSTGLSLSNSSYYYPNSTVSDTIEFELVAGRTYTLRYLSCGSSGQARITITPPTKALDSYKWDVSSDRVIEEKYEGTIVTPTPVHSNYDFVGWYDSNNNPMHEIWDYTEDQSFRAKYDIHEYQINYYLDEGINSELNPQYYTVLDSLITLSDPTKDGYTFLGWYTDPSYNNKITEINPEDAKDYTLYAKWVANFFNVNYELYGGSNNPNNKNRIGKTEDLTLENPVRAGYDFVGWYLDANYLNPVTVLHGTDNVDFTVHAKWSPLSYEAYLDYDGGQFCPTLLFFSNGQPVKTVVLYKDSTLDYFVPEAPSDDVYFGGWYLNSSYTSLFDFSSTVKTEYVYINAKWVSINNESTYASLGSNNDVTISGINEKYIAIVSPINQTVTVSSSSGLDLYGTVYDANMNKLYSNDDISESNFDFSITFNAECGKVYYIGYKANQVSTNGNAVINITGSQVPDIHVTGDYTQVIESIDVTSGKTFVLPTTMKKEGYTFAGWYDSSDNKVGVPSLWEYASDMTFTAHWTEA